MKSSVEIHIDRCDKCSNGVMMGTMEKRGRRKCQRKYIISYKTNPVKARKP